MFAFGDCIGIAKGRLQIRFLTPSKEPFTAMARRSQKIIIDNRSKFDQ
jgi:hypothetical protein